MIVKEILAKGTKMLTGKGIKSGRLDAEIILLHCLRRAKKRLIAPGHDRSWIYAHNNYPLSKKQEKEFFRLIKRRLRFEPIAYITKEKEFYGLNFSVDKNVLIPRPETEILVEEALKDITRRLNLRFLEVQPPSINKKMIIADIGTGSGAIAVSVAKILKSSGKISRAKIYATDISAKALKIARANAKLLDVERNVIFKRGNLLKALARNIKIDYLLANLPYVGNDYYRKWLENGGRPSEFHEIKHEPKKSLLAKNNGMEYFEKFFKQAPNYLAAGSKIFLESDPYQIKAIKNLAKKYLPSHKISVIKDLRGLNRVTKIEI